MTPASLDLSLFTGGNISQHQDFASKLLNSLSQHGFVKIVGHGVPKAMVVELFAWNRKFFQIPAEEKLRIAHPGGSDPQRGFSSLGAENSSSLYRKGLLGNEVTRELKDAREHFDQGAKTDDEYPNRWPDERLLPGFRECMETAFEMMEEVASHIMSALEMAFQLPRGAFMEKITHEENASEMRLLHYPAIELEEIKRGYVSRIWPHFDLGVITLLFQDNVGGLEFENRGEAGKFDRVQCDEPSELVVNVSETLQRWTNGSLRAGLHRVNVPPSLEGKESGTLPERYSITYFCKSNRSALVGPLSEFVPNGCAPKYEVLSAIDYQRQRLRSAY